MLYLWATKTPRRARSRAKFHIKKNNSLYHVTGLKIYHLSYYIYKHDAIDIADPNSMYNLEKLPKWPRGQFERTQWSLLHLDDSVKT